MKIIALCSVDESVLRSTLELGGKDTIDADTVTSEFGWLNDSGMKQKMQKKLRNIGDLYGI